MRYALRFLIILFGAFTLLGSKCETPIEKLQLPDNFWDALAGEWRLTSIYEINNEPFLASSCDQLTILNFRTLSEAELTAEVNGTNLKINNHVEIYNDNCGEQFLNLGSIIGEAGMLPKTLDSDIQLINECFNCQYFDIQYIDLLSLQTDGEAFSVEALSNNELRVRFVTNIYNRQFDNQIILDTLEYTFNKSESDIYTVSEFDVNDYVTIDWYHFDTNDPDCEMTTATIVEDGIDGNTLRFGSPTSFHPCMDYSLKDAMGADNMATISLWINPESVDRPKQIIYSKYNNTAGPFILSLENDEVVLEMNNGFGELQRFASFGTVKANEWTHISLSYEQEELLLCINGEIDQREPINSWLYDANGTILLGNSCYALENGLDQGFIGKIDELIIFKNYLNQDVMYQFYQWHLNN